MPQCSDFLVILPETIIRIPQDSHLAWLRMFYALPRELVEKRPAYLEMPRNIRRVLSSEKYRAMLQSDSFLELVWDCYAWAVWQFFQIPHKDGTHHDIPGDWQNYSGDFPLWRMSYLILPYFRNKFEYAMDWSFQNLFLAPIEHDIAWLPYQQFCNLVGNLTDLIVKEQDWQPVIDEIWNNRQPEDYTGKNIQKRDFMRSWTHSRTIPTLSLEEIKENGASISGEALYEIADPSAEFETRVLDKMKMEDFKKWLDETDRKILELRAAGHSQKEIAEKVGFKVPSAVSKRIEKIANRFEDFVSKEYGEFLDKHVE